MSWGIETSLDIHDCNPDTIRNADEIKRFIKELITLIDMKAFGETQCVHFGEDERVEGFSVVQLIETSLISGHLANATNRAYLNIFSCKAYDVDAACRFACEFFQGVEHKRVVNHRD